MSRHAAFVRNVMIGREGLHRTVLLDVFGDAGADDPRSYISTGNVTFTAQDTEVDVITGRIEAGIAGVIGRREDVFVRSIARLRALERMDPFAAAPFSDAVERTVSFTNVTLDPDDLELPIESRRGDLAIFLATPSEVFSAARLVDGRTTGAGGLVEKVVGSRVTSRAWSTVLRILADPDA